MDGSAKTSFDESISKFKRLTSLGAAMKPGDGSFRGLFTSSKGVDKGAWEDTQGQRRRCGVPGSCKQPEHARNLGLTHTSKPHPPTYSCHTGPLPPFPLTTAPRHFLHRRRRRARGRGAAGGAARARGRPLLLPAGGDPRGTRGGATAGRCGQRRAVVPGEGHQAAGGGAPGAGAAGAGGERAGCGRGVGGGGWSYVP